MIIKKKYLEAAQNMHDALLNYLLSSMEKSKKAVITASTEKEREEALRIYEQDCFGFDKKYDLVEEYIRPVIETTYDACLDLQGKLEWMFKKTELIEDGIAIEAGFRTLSDFAIMLQKMFNIKPADGFSFNSSFTTHHGMMECGHIIDITSDAQGRYVVLFKLNIGRPYWAPDDVVEKYLQKA